MTENKIIRTVPSNLLQLGTSKRNARGSVQHQRQMASKECILFESNGEGRIECASYEEVIFQQAHATSAAHEEMTLEQAHVISEAHEETYEEIKSAAHEEIIFEQAHAIYEEKILTRPMQLMKAMKSTTSIL